MKVTLGQLVTVGGTQEKPGPLQKLMSVEGFSVRIAYRLAKLAKFANDALEPFNTARNGLIEKYGSADEKGQKSITEEKDADNWPKFIEEFNALVAEEVSLAIDPVELPPEAEGVTAEMLMALEGLVTVRGEDEPKPGPTEVVK